MGIFNNFNLAPEILKGESYGTPADVYALGVCFYYLMIGNFPFLWSDSESSRIRSIENRDIDFSDGNDKELEDIIRFTLKNKI